MKTEGNKTLATIAVILILAFSAMTIGAAAQTPVRDRYTGSYLSVNPPLIGLDQPLTVNLWVYPSPAGPQFEGANRGVLQSYDNIELTFTRPDGSTITFKPEHGTTKLGLAPGQTESTGSIWFHYYPDQIGTWSAQFSYPGQTMTMAGFSVYYEPSISNTITFTVQQQKVRIGFDPVPLPGPNEYWERPISAENREWAAIAGPVYARDRFAPFNTNQFFPYTTAPESAHILWKRLAEIGGILGGVWGSTSEEAGGRRPYVGMFGRILYESTYGTVICLDVRTGEVIWDKPGRVDMGLISPTRERTGSLTLYEFAGSPNAYFWGYTGSSLTLYDFWTGEVAERYDEGVLSGSPYWIDEYTGVCIVTGRWDNEIPLRQDWNHLIKFDVTKMSGGNWSEGIVWRVSMTQPDGTGPGEADRGATPMVVNGKIYVGSPLEEKFYVFDIDTGAQLEIVQLPFPNPASPVQGFWIYDYPGVASKYMAFDSAKGEWNCLDTDTWQVLWTADVKRSAWGSHHGTPSAAYGNIYLSAYDGTVTCVDAATGQQKWQWYAGDTTETPFGTYPLRRELYVADGKIYVAPWEHSATQPLFRGASLWCIDAYTGDLLWNVSGWTNPSMIFEGALIAANKYDGYIHCYNKGKTETTVTAPDVAITKGTSAVIKGTVMDLSPAQPNTPAISDEDMSEWMNYLHMQKPKPMDITGVPVKLTAVASGGSTIDIGTATSDMGGAFGMMWTPPAAGTYMIMAEFEGSNSYWPSMATTYLGVTAGPSAQPAFEPLIGPAEAQAATIDLTLVVAAIVAIAVIAVAIVLRRRK